MSNPKRFNFSLKVFFSLLLVALSFFFFQFVKDQFIRDAIVSSVKKGNIRDSVSGNVRVLAELSFELCSETQSKLEYAALIPFGKPVSVEKNQILFSMNTEDLNRSLERTLLSKSSHEKRLETGSSIQLQLELEEKNLKSYKTISKENSNDISGFELESKINLVERLRRQVEFERISDEETSKSLNLEIARIEEELKKRMILSPIKGTLVSSTVKQGDTIFSGQVLGEIQSDERIIEVTLKEEDFDGIVEGQKVGVTVFTFGNEVFEGAVKRISANVDPATGRRKLFVELESKKPLPVGSSGRAEIIKREINDTLIIPRKALLGSSVFVVRDGRAFQINVEIGAKNLEFVEIIKGLKSNELVISETPHLFYDGENVNWTLIR